MSNTPTLDVIDRLAGIAPGDPRDALRARRLQARIHAQQSYVALLEPVQPVPGDFSLVERFAVAVFVAELHRDEALARFYAEGLAAHGAPAGLRRALSAAAALGAGQGPYGRFPAGPLSAEDAEGPRLALPEEQARLLGPRLAAALAHAHLLVFHPRDAAADDLRRLLNADWSSTDIVTLSQLVAFLSFQVRVVAGLGALNAASP